jgi:uncharacterized repeat protein (TIGR03803 family)
MKRHDTTLFQKFLETLITLLAFTCISFAGDSSEQVLHRFQGPDGANPYGNLIWDEAGNLYGTTEYMGTSFYGTVFRLAQPANVDDPWTLTTLHSFKNHGDGARPTDGLIFDKQGNLYGTTSDSDAGGYGEIFQLAPPATKGGEWTETVLHHFRGGTDGAYPQGGLISDELGNLYGATEDSVFEMSPPAEAGGAWKFTLLHDFRGGMNDGLSPEDGLVRDAAGNLYGSTIWGGYEGNPDCGEIGCGTVFEVSPPAAPGGEWTEQILHFFGVGKDGFDPEGGLALDAKGNLYGTSYSGGESGGGTAYKLAPPSQPGGAWTETVIHGFSYSRTDGAAPIATMILDPEGNLYGTTMFGGASCYIDGAFYGCGTAFKLSPANKDGTLWNESVLYFFQPGPGNARQSAASLLFDNFGNLYGTTVYGGDDEKGTIFRIVP